jgi:hypothetical protein
VVRGRVEVEPIGPIELEDTDRTRYRLVVANLGRSARFAGRKAVTSGRWLAETVIEMAPHVPVRDAATLSKHHDGREGTALARAMITAAGRVSAAIGAAAGGLVAVQEVSIAGAVAIPFELAAETALVVLVELKLIAELHEVAGRPFQGSARDKAAAAIRSWASGRGMSARTLISPGSADLLGRATRRAFTVRLRKRYARNLTTLAPMLIGSGVAAWLNRRATREVGRQVARDLGVGR